MKNKKASIYGIIQGQLSSIVSVGENGYVSKIIKHTYTYTDTINRVPPV